MNLLFAIDEKMEEVIVSESPKGINKINFIERIQRKDNEALFRAVSLLTLLATAADLDDKLFNAMEKVCQLMYNRHKQIG